MSFSRFRQAVSLFFRRRSLVALHPPAFTTRSQAIKSRRIITAPIIRQRYGLFLFGGSLGLAVSGSAGALRWSLKRTDESDRYERDPAWYENADEPTQIKVEKAFAEEALRTFIGNSKEQLKFFVD